MDWRTFAGCNSTKRDFVRNLFATVGTVATLCLAFTFAGCQKKIPKPSAAEIHGVTQQLAAAASARAPIVKVRKSATDSDSASHDALYIGLAPGSPPTAQAAQIALLQSIEQIVTRNKLTQDEPITSRNSLRILVRRNGFVTHEIEIATRGSPAGEKSLNSAESPRLAILLDDLGSDRAAADAIFALRYPLTLSILPGHQHSEDIAQEAHRLGFEVMLHLPMESVGKEQPESQELRPGMGASQVSTLVGNFLAEVPNVAGVNNHQGSEATANRALMDELMPILRTRNLFYIDSRTTAATVAYDAAQQAGVRSGYRDVPFLDDVEEVAAIRKQLELAFRHAKEKGEAVAIGHPHAATLQALREMLPHADAQGIHIVPVSQLVH